MKWEAQSVCKQPGGKRLPARLLKTDRETDLALLEVEGANFQPIQWYSTAPMSIGSWVAAAGPADKEPLVVGVISATTREIDRDNALLGVNIEQDAEGPRIIKVLKGSTAALIGLKPNDVVTHVAGQRVMTQMELINKIKAYRPADTVEVRVLRDGDDLKLSARLGRIGDVLAAEQGFDEHVGGNSVAVEPVFLRFFNTTVRCKPINVVVRWLIWTDIWSA